MERECRYILFLFGVLHEIIIVRHDVKPLTEKGVPLSEQKIRLVESILGQPCEWDGEMFLTTAPLPGGELDLLFIAEPVRAPAVSIGHVRDNITNCKSKIRGG